MMMGTANNSGRFITRSASRPQEPVLTSALVLVFSSLAPGQVIIRLLNCQSRRNGTLRRVVTLSASTSGPSIPRMAGSTVIDRRAANVTDGDHGVGEGFEEALREEQQAADGRRDQHRRERDGAPGVTTVRRTAVSVS